MSGIVKKIFSSADKVVDERFRRPGTFTKVLFVPRLGYKFDFEPVVLERRWN